MWTWNTLAGPQKGVQFANCKDKADVVFNNKETVSQEGKRHATTRYTVNKRRRQVVEPAPKHSIHIIPFNFQHNFSKIFP